jgi:hypothetical protein
MLIPNGMFVVREYDATFTITPTSRFDHDSDTVLATVEMLVENSEQQEIEFPFYVLTTDPGTGATSQESVEPHVLNGSRPVEVQPADEVDENQFAEVMVQRAQAAGMSDAADLEAVRDWGRRALQAAERAKVGRTRIGPNEKRRIILQQRLRVLPEPDGRFIFETLAPSPVATIPTGGRISVVVLLPWEDEDVKPSVVVEESTRDFEFEQGRIKMRQLAAWHWRNDPLLRLVYRYA